MAELWFRSYHGAPTDPKWKVVAKRAGGSATPGHVAAIWFYLEDFASQHSDRGSIDGFDPELIADFYEWPVELVQAVEQALRDKKLIDSSTNRLMAWNRRQPKREDYSTDRVRRHREKHTQDPKTVDTKRRATQRNAVKRNETPDEIREDERRVDKNKKQRTFDKSNGAKPRVSRSRPKGLGARLAPLIREHLWLGDTPPATLAKSTKHRGWNMAREISTAEQLIEKAEIDVDALAGAIEHVRSTLGFGDDQLSLLVFNVEGRLDRLHRCVSEWRKANQPKRRRGGLQAIGPDEVGNVSR